VQYNLTSYFHFPSSHLRLGLTSGVFPSRFPLQTLCISHLSTHATWPVHLILYHFIALISERVQIMKLLMTHFFPASFNSLLDPNILLFSCTLNVRFVLWVRRQVSRTIQTNGQNYNLACYKHYIFRQEMGRQNTVEWTVDLSRGPWTKSSLNLSWM